MKASQQIPNPVNAQLDQLTTAVIDKEEILQLQQNFKKLRADVEKLSELVQLQKNKGAPEVTEDVMEKLTGESTQLFTEIFKANKSLDN